MKTKTCWVLIEATVTAPGGSFFEDSQGAAQNKLLIQILLTDREKKHYRLAKLKPEI